MRSFYISLIIIIFLLSGWFLINNYLDDTVTSINKDMKVLQNYVDQENWKEIASSIEKIDVKWKNSLKVLMLVIDHDEMEKVNHSLVKVDEYIKAKDIPLLIGEISSLKYLVNHVREKESLSLDNIF